MPAATPARSSPARSSRARPARAVRHTALAAAVAGLAACTPEPLAVVSPRPASPAASLPAPGDRASNATVLAWNQVTNDALAVDNGHQAPYVGARALAIVHLAQHDAINSVAPAYATYAVAGGGGAADAGADPDAAAAAAAYGALVGLFPAQRAAFDAALARSLAAVPDGAAEDAGVKLGLRAATAMLVRRAADGSNTPIVGDYTPGAGPGRYQFTAPFTFAVAPGWRHVTPFALERPDQFRPAPPPALDGKAYAAAFNEVRSLGRAGSPARTPEQSAIAKFWYETSEQGWNRIARTVADERGLGLRETARLFALVNMAMSDSYVAGWDAKYHYDFWRPVTAIAAADTDGNPNTHADPAWEPAELTPPVQDYPSTHSALGRAAAEVLADLLGDETPFAFASPTADPAHPVRSFAGFRQAADENAESRVLGGLHFRFATAAGQELGARIGRWTAERHLRPR